jgi:hypothetical protein
VQDEIERLSIIQARQVSLKKRGGELYRVIQKEVYTFKNLFYKYY